MIGLIQRVSHAKVVVDGATVGQIEQGILLLLGVEKADTPAKAERLLERILGYRIFADEAGKMNLSLRNIQGGLLIVPQFTLPADTAKGLRLVLHPPRPLNSANRYSIIFAHKLNSNLPRYTHRRI